MVPLDLLMVPLGFRFNHFRGKVVLNESKGLVLVLHLFSFTILMTTVVNLLTNRTVQKYVAFHTWM
jgi:hypothetical protein